MSRTLAEFQAFLRNKLGSDNVYSQEPASVMMNYPAFKFKPARIDNQHADNTKYFQRKAYTLIYITEDIDDPFVDDISKWDFCTFDRWYAADNLNHFVFTIYY